MDEIAIGNARLRLTRGDIVHAGTEAIVNAANEALAGGSGVDGAIHRAAGLELYDLTRPLGGCPTGSAVITGAGRIPLPTRFIIHAVGPRWRQGHEEACAELLAGAYRTSMRLAVENRVASVAFPSISTGIFSYPIERAARIALSTVAESLRARPQSSRLTLAVFVLFSDADLDVYRAALGELARTS